uniref:zinc finger BED domain-containing protein RICESLEEPER 2-like n=1 Tax=Erigeron canadensis TaxID=72917 RepID=UPI001CB9CFAA|nr:zinc finger BED domain-containing protein RICESLEEPER 2-like [Erigeron canadensis]
MLKGPHAILDCKYLHLRCCAHIINLVVRDGLDEQFQSIARIRNAVRYVRSSCTRYDNFTECVQKLEISCKRKPCLDVETRWNSTYHMLEIAEKYEVAFNRLSSVDFNYRSYFRGSVEDDGEESTRKRKRGDRVAGAPKVEDWETARLVDEPD